MNKKFTLLSFGFCFLLSLNLKAQTINSNFFGQNAWFTVYTDDGQQPANNDAFITYINEVKASGATYCRIGGANANILGNCNPTCTNIPITNSQMLNLVKRIRAAGMEPIIQVPYFNQDNDNSDLSLEAGKAAAMVEFINITKLADTGGYPVINWAIANEPDQNTNSDGYKNGYNYNACDQNSPANIATYIRKFAVEMRKKDPNNVIKIIGPSLSEYWSHFFFGGTYVPPSTSPCYNGGLGVDFTNKGLLQIGKANDISGLISITDDPGNTVVGRPFIDYVNFHYYGTSDDRNAVIQNIHSTGPGKIKANLTALNNFCTSSALATIRGGSFPLKVVITEANLKNTTNPETDGNSFILGQWWCDFASVCLSGSVQWINYWSSSESSYGFLNNSGGSRSSYWHFNLMATYLKSGTFYNAASIKDNGSLTITDVKSFAAKVGNQFIIVIINQKNTGGPFSYKVKSNANPTGAAINIGFPSSTGLSYNHSDNISPEETQWLVFNCAGNYEGKWIYNVVKNNNGASPEWIPEANAVHSFTVNNNCSGGCGANSNSSVNIQMSGTNLQIFRGFLCRAFK